MAFSEAERVQIRRWLGFDAIFQNSYPRLETAITACQSKDEGGSRPDKSTEIAITGWLAKLENIEVQWDKLLSKMMVSSVDEIAIDAPRGVIGIAMVGRKYVGFISDALGTKPYRDVFADKKPNPHPPGLG